MTSFKIILTKKGIKKGISYTDVAHITENMSVTKYENPKDANAAYLALKNKGISAGLTKNVLIQRYKGKNTKEVLELHLKQIEELKKMFKKKLEIKYEVIKE